MNTKAVMFVVVTMFGTGCRATEPAPSGETVPQTDLEAFVTGNTMFALDLYARLKGHPVVKQAQGNLIFSPYSISTALAMTAGGARGATAEQMAATLHIPGGGNPAMAFGELQEGLQTDAAESGCQLNIANALWGQKGHVFLDSFLSLTKSGYGANLNEVDFGEPEQARRTINTWIEEQTKDKIKDLIGPGVLGAMTRLVLTNAIYFKGDWAVQFKKDDTRPAPFFLVQDGADGSSKSVQTPMMYQKGTFAYGENDDTQVLLLPYKGEALSMLILLPKAPATLDSVEGRLDVNSLELQVSGLRKQEVQVYLPKFKMTTGAIELRGVLAAMGMKDAFNPAAADFSGMDGKKDLFLSNVAHKAFVEVNEEGTEAAAATGVVVGIASVRITPIFRADHPFVFFIRDNKTGSILFIGRVMNPTLE
jgi:serpin B